MLRHEPANSAIEARRIIIFLLAAAALSLTVNLGYLFFRGFSPFMLDFRVFWRAAGADLDTLYRSVLNPFIYPPTSLIFFRPLGWMSLPTGYLIWSLLSALSFAAIVTRLAGPTVALISFLSAAALQGLALGQTPMLLSAAALTAVLLPPLWRGALLGLLMSIKPQLLLMAPVFFLVRRDWTVLVGMAAGGLSSLVIELALYGPGLWPKWVTAVQAFPQAVIEANAAGEVITPKGVAEFYGVVSWPFYVMSICLALGVAIASAKRLEDIYLVAAIVGASILASPYALRHDTIALIPAAIAIMSRRASLTSLPACGIFAGVLVPACLIISACQLIWLRDKWSVEGKR